MTENEFYAAVAENILDFLPESFQDAEVIIEERLKDNNTRVHGLAIRKEGGSAMPIMYLDDTYQKEKDNDYLEEHVLSGIANNYLVAINDLKEIEIPDMSPEAVLENVRCRAIDIRANERLLKNLVHKDLGCGYAMVLYRSTTIGNREGMIQITHDLAKGIGLSEDELVKQALSNTQKAERATFTPVVVALLEPSEKPPYLSDLAETGQDFGLTVLTNDQIPSMYGATVLFYPDTQEKIAKVLDSNYYVLPSSIHEVLIWSEREYFETGGIDKEGMVHMVKDINEAQVAPQERFGNRVLFYDRDARELSVVADLDRVKSKEMVL